MDALSLPQLTPWLLSMGTAAGKAVAKIALIVAIGLVAMRFLRPAFWRIKCRLETWPSSTALEAWSQPLHYRSNNGMSDGNIADG